VIEGVVRKELVTHAGDRGFFRELIRVNDSFFSDGFGQASHSIMYADVVKAWHGHRHQTQWTYIASGLVRVAVHDFRKDSQTFGRTEEWLLGDHHPPFVYRLPPGVVHGLRCLAGPAHVFYVTSGTCDLENDELRVPHDDPRIPYDWSKDPTIR